MLIFGTKLLDLDVPDERSAVRRILQCEVLMLSYEKIDKIIYFTFYNPETSIVYSADIKSASDSGHQCNFTD